jgi:outer membrane receptor protein involved in Fe transport
MTLFWSQHPSSERSTRRSRFSRVSLAALAGASRYGLLKLGLVMAMLPVSLQAVEASRSSTGATDPSTVAMPSMTVTEQRLDMARAEIAPSLGAVAYTIGPNQIQTMSQGESTPFQQVILQVPGVVQDEFGEEHVRGDHGDVQYRINGVLLPESLNGFAQEVDVHLIQAVTLLTGTMPAQFGDRTAGIIDVTTKTGSQLNGGEFSLYGGSYATFNPSLQLGGSSGKLDYFVSVSQLHNDHGIDDTTSNPTPLHDVTGQERFFGYFSHPFDATSRLTLLLSSSDARFQIPDTAGVDPIYQLTGGPPADSATTNNYQLEQNYYAVVSYQKFAGAISSQISVFSRRTEIDFHPDVDQSLLLAGNAAHVDNSDLANGVQIDASDLLGDSHTLRAGILANYDSEQLDTTSAVFPSNSQFTASPTTDIIPQVGGPVPLPGNPPQSSFTPFDIIANGGNSGVTAGIYLQDEWRVNDHLTLNYGLRYDHFDVSFDNESQLSPRINLVWKIDAATSFHIGYARYFMPPTLQHVPLSTVKEFEYTTDAPFNEADDPQKVERDNYFDAGYSQQLLPGWQITGDGQFGSAVILNNFNYRTGTVYGGEFGTSYAQGPLSVYGNFSYVQTWAKAIDTVENEFANNALAYLAANSIQLDHQGRYTGSGGAAYSLTKDTRLHTDILYGNGLRAGFANLDKLPAYWEDNVGIEHVWHFNSKEIHELRIRFDCLNVFNTVAEIRNGTGVGIAAPAYAPRRGYYGGLTLVF